MNSDNILSISVANAVSILIMAAVGGALLAMLRKGLAGRMSGNADAVT
jgi:hypothetical protein